MSKILFNFCEFGNKEAESITKYFSDKPYEGKETVIQYMKTHGEARCACGLGMDFLTGKILGTSILYRDGEYSWISDLIYYIEKYNFKPPDEFIRYALNNS